MKYRLAFLLTLLIPSILPVIAADDQMAANSLGRAAAVSRKAGEKSRSATATPTTEVLFTDVTIAPGEPQGFNWDNDLSGAERVAISVTTLDNETFLTKIRIGVAFAAYSSWFVLTDVIKGSSFVFKNHGGATVPVYGPAMKLMIFNDGDTPVKISQLTLYAVAH